MSNTSSPMRKFGVEIEFTGIDEQTAVTAINAAGIPITYEGYTHRTSETWKLVRDSSCGLEAVSPVLQGEDGLRQIAKVCEALTAAGAKVDRKCGYHVHLDVADFELSHFKNLVKLWVKFEDVFDTFQPPSRRLNSNVYCMSNLNSFGMIYDGETHAEACQRAFKAIDATDSIQALGALFASRYHKLNVQAYFRHRTIEVRHHAGTLNADKAVNWVRLMMELYDTARTAKTIRVRPSNDETGIARHKWFFQRTTPQGLRRFYTRRARELERAAA